MLRRVEIPLELSQECRIHPSMGSIMQGVIMERIPAVEAEALHKEDLRPYSQCVYYDKEKQQPIWRLCFLTRQAYEVIYGALERADVIFLNKRGYEIGLKPERIQYETSYEEIADKAFGDKVIPKGSDIVFLTATAFKRKGQYEICPETYLILQSLIQRWNVLSSVSRLEEQGLSERLARNCKMARFQLQSKPFSLEGSNIFGFSGNIRFLFRGNEMMRRLLGLLFLYAPYCGVGIKTAIGMGAAEVKMLEE